MNNHTDLLNLISAKIAAKSYLEIGVYRPSRNFNLINVPNKISVDPDPKARAIRKMTSDKYFGLYSNLFDLIFIDGLHHADQVKRDLINSWAVLNDGGVIVMHDCNPPTEATTCVPRGKQKEWCGDVYRIASIIPHFLKFTVDFDYGCMVIRKVGDGIYFEDFEYDWEYFDNNRRSLLNLLTIDQAVERIGKW